MDHLFLQIFITSVAGKALSVQADHIKQHSSQPVERYVGSGE
jgi:hypothetical protein